MIALFLTLGCKYSQGHVNITIYESCVLAHKKKILQLTFQTRNYKELNFLYKNFKYLQLF